MVQILDAKLKRSNGSITGTFWIKDWKLPVEFLKTIAEHIEPYRVVSYHLFYIYGFSGKETKVRVFGVKVKELEVEDEGKKT